MVTDPFDPAAWLARWKAAGGAWVTTVLFRPRLHADDITLNRLCEELDDHNRRALVDHLQETTR